MLLRQLWIVWGALLASLLIYGAMPLWIPPAEPSGGPPRTLFAAILAGVGAATGLATLAIRRLALVRPIADGTLELASPAGETRLYVVSMLCWMLSESIGIYGLVLFFLYRDPALLYPFLAAAIALLAWHAPRTAGLRRLAPAGDLARPDVRIG